MRYALALTMLVAGCNGRDLIALHYALDQIDPTDVIRVETVISIAPGDAREFFADQPYRSVATGVGYEVRDVDGSGKRSVLITHDATLGYQFAPTFTFTLLPPTNESAPPLAIVARAMGASQMIGETMAIDAKFGPNATAEVKIGNQRCGGAACLTSETCCSDSCTKVDQDAENCGGCGMSCNAAETCSGTVCRCAGGSACMTGQTCCATMGCFDFANDPFNCGSCGHACKAGETCTSGTCGCNGGTACGTGQVCCPGVGCGTSCACGVMACDAPKFCCPGDNCVDTSQDNANCGTCGHACTTPFNCANGSCRCNGVACAPGDACCTSGCANTKTDPANCGACGHSCNAGETCMNSQCVCGSAPCSPGQICCPGGATTGPTCVDPNGDRNNCGFCGNRCGTGEMCTNSMCTCAGNPHCVGNETCCTSGCADLANDPLHCGSCGHACNAGEACTMGMCVATGCQPPCSNGNVCMGTTCTCNGGAACGNGTTCCQGQGCVNLQFDPLNCGNCGKPCGTGDLCCNGICTPQGDGNCGGCSIKCGSFKPKGSGISTPDVLPDGGTSGGMCCPPCSPGGNWMCSVGGLCVACPGGPT
jgi:hypothetical protein